MLKDHLKAHHLTVKAVSARTGIPYSTLNDIINGKTEIDRVAFGTVRKLAAALDLTLDQLAEQCARSHEKEAGDHEIMIRNKKYYLKYQGQEIYLFKVNAVNSDYVGFAADAYLDSQRRKKEVEDKWTGYTSL